MTTREQARKATAKPKPGRPKAFVFQYRPPTKTFNLRLQFKKSDVDRTEVIAALEAIIADLREGPLRRTRVQVSFCDAPSRGNEPNCATMHSGVSHALTRGFDTRIRSDE